MSAHLVCLECETPRSTKEQCPCPYCGCEFVKMVDATPDPVNKPAHYRWLPSGVEVIDITEQFSFTLGNVLKYVMRADHKGKPIEDLRKARWYLDREIARREASDG